MFLIGVVFFAIYSLDVPTTNAALTHVEHVSYNTAMPELGTWL